MDNYMHMHDSGYVRTTLEMSDEHRAAIESYLKAEASRAARRRNARALKGILSRTEGERLRGEAAALRRSWR